MQSAELGLEPGSVLGRAYLVPYKDECQLQIGYKGYVELAKRSGKVRCVSASEVKEGEVFEFEKGTSPYLRHIPNSTCSNSKPVAYYAVITYKDGSTNFEVLWKADVDKIRSIAPSANSPAWREWYGEMGKKCVIKRLLKTEELSPELSTAVALDDMADAGVHQNLTAPKFTAPIHIPIDEGKAEDVDEETGEDRKATAEAVEKAKAKAKAKTKVKAKPDIEKDLSPTPKDEIPPDVQKEDESFFAPVK